MEKRFIALRVYGTVFKILAWVSLVIGILLAFAALVLGLTTNFFFDLLNLPVSGTLLGIVAFVLLLVLSVISFLGLYATGELLYLAIGLEENTRRAAYLAQQQFLAAQAGQPTPPQALSGETGISG
jgi:hypothetical protein